jgi:prophage DNA circulation protein
MDKIEISVNVITGEITQTVSQFTTEELDYSSQVTAQSEAKAQAIIDKKVSALDKLTALGLTQDEIKALLN